MPHPNPLVLRSNATLLHGIGTSGYGFVLVFVEITIVFPLQEIIKRWGLENRLQTAGENKAIDNPFVEKSEAAVARTQRVLVAIHQHFISFVKGEVRVQWTQLFRIIKIIFLQFVVQAIVLMK